MKSAKENDPAQGEMICSLHGRQRKKKAVDMKGALVYAKEEI